MALTAITRQVSPSLNNCELSFHARERIDVARATEQHRTYQDCLAALGSRIISLPAEPELPDSVFVEDTAVVLDEVAVITNPGAPSRRGELETMATALAPYRALQFLGG